MPGKKEATEAVKIPPLPEGIYDYDFNESIVLDVNGEEQGDSPIFAYKNVLQDQARVFPGDYLAYCAIAGAHPHPSIPRVKRNKIEEKKEGIEEGKGDNTTEEEVIPIEQESIEGIKSITIKNQALDMISLHLLLLSLEGNTEITELTLFNCDLKKSAIAVLARALPLTNISSLALDYNPLLLSSQNEDNLEVNKVLLSSLFHEEESKLISISLRGNHLTSTDIEIIAEKLALNANLKSLNLFGNDIDDEGLELLLSNGLKENKCLENLSISNNKISDFACLVKCFPPNIRYLNIAQNDMVRINSIEDLISSITNVEGTTLALKTLCMKNSESKLVTGPIKEKLQILSEEHGILINM